MTNRRRRAKTLNTAIGVVTAILVLLFLLDYSDTGTPPGLPGESDTAVPHPGYFLSGTTSTQYNDDGELEFTLTTREIRHNPTDDSAKLKTPHFEMFRQSARSWIGDAQLGRISGDGETLDLEQQVVIRSDDGDTVLKTPQLTLFPDKKLAKTDKPVTLQNPNGFTRSIGLTADLNHKRIDLLHQVRSQYQGVLFENEK